MKYRESRPKHQKVQESSGKCAKAQESVPKFWKHRNVMKQSAGKHRNPEMHRSVKYAKNRQNLKCHRLERYQVYQHFLTVQE